MRMTIRNHIVAGCKKNKILRWNYVINDNFNRVIQQINKYFKNQGNNSRTNIRFNAKYPKTKISMSLIEETGHV